MTRTNDAERREVLKEALHAIEELEKRLAAAEAAPRQPIAIVGMACRFPGGAEDPEAYWRLLRAGVDTIQEVPAERWDIARFFDPDPSVPGKTYTRWGGFLRQVDLFDAHFFGIAPREAVAMDPQQRLFLEVAWEALERGGQAPGRLAGSQTGVFAGVTMSEYLQLSLKRLSHAELDAYLTPGTVLNAVAGRVSYLLGLHGPAMAVDTACSSSLVAVHLACQSLRAGECDRAIAGGVNVVLAPETFICFSKWGMMARDGRCKTFDAAADGFVRGEGCGVVVLKRLSDALADGDEVLAVIRGSAVNQDGPSSGLTVPNGLAQQAVIRTALANAGVEPSEIGYVEAHGTGTSLGDPIEVEALGAALGAGGSPETPLLIGSVKTNLGHLESAAGIAGLIKVVLALQHGEIPPNLHFKVPSPHIPWERMAFRVPTTPTPWPNTRPKRVAGVSAFGFSGTNAHVVLEEGPPRELPWAHVERPVHLLALSGKSARALRELAERYQRCLVENQELSFADVTHSANVGRTHFAHRLALVAASSEEARAKLQDFVSGDAAPGVLTGQAMASARLRVAFLFTGQGSQYVGMGRLLFQTQPTFRRTLEMCEALLRPHLERPLLSVLFPGPGEASPLDETAYTQPALFALEYALCELWRSWGVEPSVVMGHSVGEYVAACVAGVFGLEDGLRLIAERGRLMQSLPRDGEMAALLTDEARVAAALAPHAGDVSIASINGPRNVVISGRARAVDAVIETLASQGVQAHRLKVSHAFHSPLMEPILSAFEQVTSRVRFHPPRISLISNLTGRTAGAEVAESDYWRRHLRQAVRFSAGMETLHAKGYGLFLEIGPSPTLSGMGANCLPEGAGLWLTSLRKGKDEWMSLLESLARLYLQGVEVDWRGFDRDYPHRRVTLPTYPFQRERYWIRDEEPRTVSTERCESTAGGSPSLLGGRLRSPVIAQAIYERRIGGQGIPLLRDHRIHGRILVPGTAYLDMALTAAADALGGKARTLENVTVQEACVLADESERILQLVLTPDDGSGAKFEVFSRSGGEHDPEAWRLHASGRVREQGQDQRDGGDPADVTPDAVAARCAEEVDPTAFYRRLEEHGVQFGPRFKGIVELRRGDHEALGRIELDAVLEDELLHYHLHPGLLDAALQTALAAWQPIGQSIDPRDGAYVPMGVERLTLLKGLSRRLWSHATIRRHTAATADVFTADIRILDVATGQLVAEVRGLVAKRADQVSLVGGEHHDIREWLYELAWQPVPLADVVPSQENPGSWLLLCDGDGIGPALAARLRELGSRCVLARAAAAHEVVGEDELALDPTSATDLQAAWALCGRHGARTFRGVVHLWSVEVGASDETGAEEFDATQRLGCRSLLPLVQALATADGEPPPRLLVVTRGAQGVAESDRIRPAQAAIWGLARAVRAEQPELRLTCVDLDGLGDSVKALQAELLARDGECEVAYRTGTRLAARLVRLPRRPERTLGATPSALTVPMQLQVQSRGTLENLEMRPVERRSPGLGEVEIRVRATGLNFRDVLNVLGMYPGEAGALGSECAGQVVRLGEGVGDLHIGHQVIALAEGCFSTYVTVRADRVVPKPPALSFEQAAAIPIAFMTAAYALRTLGGISAGDRVLIHAAAGGVGLAAVQLAQQAGAEIYATAGSEEKRAFLRGLGVPHVMSSRSLEFTSEVMRLTGNRGVDIILNSLSGEYIPRSLSVLAPGGRFLEIGKTGIWDADRVARVTTRAAYHVIYLGEMLDRQSALTRTMLAGLLAEFSDGRLNPLPQRVFPLEEAQSAFRFMAQAKHIGKIVLAQGDVAGPDPERALVGADATYLITGGMGALGRQTAEWLVARGARHLALMGRNAPGSEARDMIKRLEAKGARILVIPADVSREPEVASALAEIRRTMPPLRGVIHAAGVLDDGVLVQQDWARFRTVMAPKAVGAWNLHRLTRDAELDFFILFSSMAGLLGSPGQANYAAANAFLDGLAHYRRTQRLCATSIDWGAWAGGGMAAALSAQQWGRWQDRGARAMTAVEATRVLDYLLERGVTQAAALPLDWPAFRRWCSRNGIPRVWSALVSPDPAAARPAPGPSFRQRFEGSPPERRRPILAAHVREQIMAVLGLPGSADLDPHVGLRELGLDSLMSVELRNRLQSSLERSLPSTLAFDYPNLASLAKYLADQLLGEVTGLGGDEVLEAETAAARELKEMSEAEAEARLAQELEALRQGELDVQ